MKKYKCENCEQPCGTTQGIEDTSDEFGVQRRFILISDCCHDEVYRVEDESEEADA